MLKSPWSHLEGNSREQWRHAASTELNGEDPFAKLSFRRGNLEIKPYYDQHDNSGSSFALSPAVETHLGARAWVNAPKVAVKDEKTANQLALDHLRNGADGICFELQKEKIEIHLLLSEILLPHCSVYFQGITPASLQKDFAQYVTDHFDITTVKGGFFHAALTTNDIRPFLSWPLFRSSGLVLMENNEEEILVQGLLEAVHHIDQCIVEGLEVPPALRQVSFSLPVSVDFFFEIAKLRAVRILWNAVARAYGVDDATQHVHAHWRSHVLPAYQPHGNMLGATFGALAATLGGCDALTVDAENADDLTQIRVARNISSVLREESHLSKVADPVGGAYYIESLTDALVKNVWRKFVTIVA